MDLSHGADDARLHPLINESSVVARVAVVAHLRHDLRPLRRVAQHARFVDGPGQRLLDEDVLAELHRRFRNDRVGVIGRGHEDGVDILLLLEHLPKVGVALRFRIGVLQLRRGRIRLPVPADEPSGDGFVDEAEVDVRERHDVLATRDELRGIAGTLRAAPDDGDVQPVAGRFVSSTAQHVAGDDHEARRRARSSDERPTTDFVRFHFRPQ